MHCFQHLVNRIKQTPTLRYAVDNDLMDIGFYNLRDRSCNAVTIVLRDCLTAMLAEDQPNAYLGYTAALAVEALRPYVEESPVGMTKTIGAWYEHPGPVPPPADLEGDSVLVPEALLKLRARALALPTVKSLSAAAAQRGDVLLGTYPRTNRSFYLYRSGRQQLGVALHYSEVLKALSS